MELLAELLLSRVELEAGVSVGGALFLVQHLVVALLWNIETIYVYVNDFTIAL